MSIPPIPCGPILAAACLCALATLTGELEAKPRFEVVQGFELGSEQPPGSLVADAAGNRYGTAFGGAGGCGTVFKMAPDGSISTLHHFDSVNGQIPGAHLAAGADGNFYGVSHSGGSTGGGNVFRITPAGEFTVLHDFTGGADGYWPGTGLLAANDGNLYGCTLEGGANGRGTFFCITPAGVLTVLHNWAQDAIGRQPSGNIIQGSDGNFYGTTRYNNAPGHPDSGTIYRITPTGSASVVGTFAGIDNMDFCQPQGLMQASDGNFYGVTQTGGINDYGTVFKATPSGQITLLAEFAYYQNSEPSGALVEGLDGHLYGTSRYGGTAGHGTLFRISKSGSITTLANLDYENGPANPTGGLIREADGNFLGLSQGGGSHYRGTAFRMTPAGEISVISHFHGDPDNHPVSKLLLASDGNFYGRTSRDGLQGNGIFRVTPQGELASFPGLPDDFTTDIEYHAGFAEGSDGNLFSFDMGSGPYRQGEIYRLNAGFERETFYTFDGSFDGGGWPNSLMKGADGNFYGTTLRGGNNDRGTVFKLDPGGRFTLLGDFEGEFPDLPNPDLTRTSDGSLYGTTKEGGAEGFGTVFKVGPKGGLTILAEFTSAGADGRMPVAGLMEASDGNLYGVLPYGGSGEAGTIYKITPEGEMSTLHAFNVADGAGPVGQLAEGPDGALYGATQDGGSAEWGTVFRITKDGDLSTVFNFDAVHGSEPLAGLTAGNDGSLYGTTSTGGVTSEGKPAGGGQIFRIRFGAEVETQAATPLARNSAILNATVNPGGYDTAVTFDYGTSPSFARFSSIAVGTLPAGTEPVNVEAEIAGLVPGKTYYFRVVAVNDETPRPQAGEIVSFETARPAEIVVATNNGRVLSKGSILATGPIKVGGSGNLELSIRNTGNTTPLTGVGATIRGGGGQFSITGIPDGTVPAGSSTACTILFQPRSFGLKTAKLVITSSDPDESPMTIRLYGIALPGSKAQLLGSH